MKQLKTKDKSILVRNIVNDEPTFARFNYVDRKGNTSHRLVRLDCVTPDENGNWNFYNFSDGAGNGGGIRSFNNERISDFEIVE